MEKKLSLRLYTDEEIELIKSDFDTFDKEEYELAENIEDMIMKEKQKKNKILEIIQDCENISLKQLIIKTGFSPEAIEWFTDELEQEGKIQKKIDFQSKKISN